MGMSNGAAAVEVPKILKRPTVRSGNSPSGFLPKSIESSILKRDLTHTCVAGVIHSS